MVPLFLTLGLYIIQENGCRPSMFQVTFFWMSQKQAGPQSITGALHICKKVPGMLAYASMLA